MSFIHQSACLLAPAGALAEGFKALFMVDSRSSLFGLGNSNIWMTSDAGKDAEYYDVVGIGEVWHMDVGSNLNPWVIL